MLPISNIYHYISVTIIYDIAARCFEVIVWGNIWYGPLYVYNITDIKW